MKTELKGIDENTESLLLNAYAEDPTCEEWETIEWLNKCKIVNDGTFITCTGPHVDGGETTDKWKIVTVQKLELIANPRLNTGSPEIPDNSIPEKWCVRRTPENAEVLNAWGNSLSRENKYTDGCMDWQGNGWSGMLRDYPEITYEQWQTIPEVVEWLKSSRFSEEETKRLDNLYSMYDVVSPHGLLLINQQRHFVVTNSEEKTLFSVSVHPKPEEREIIGYKCPIDLFCGDIKKGTLYKRDGEEIEYNGYSPDINVDSDLYYLPEEIVETWEPVYKEAPKPEFKLGDWVAARYNGVKELYIGKVSEIDPRILLNPYYLNGPDNEGVFNEGLFHEIIRLATPEEIEKATFKPVWERFPTWESLGHDTHVHEGKIKVAANSLLKLSQIEKAWNEGKKGSWTVSLVNGRLATRQTLTYSAQINFASETLAEKSLELHGDLWRKFWMV